MADPDNQIPLTAAASAILQGAMSAAITALGPRGLSTFVTPSVRMVQGLLTEDVQPELPKALSLPVNSPRQPYSLPLLWIVTRDGAVCQAWPMEHVSVCPEYEGHGENTRQVGLTINVSSKPLPTLPHPSAENCVGHIGGRPLHSLETRRFSSDEMARLPPSG